MKKISALFWIVLLFISCQKTRQPEAEKPDQPLSIETINTHIRGVLQQQNEFNWHKAPVDIIWSALVQSDKILSVGYKPIKETNVEQRLHTINIKDEAWRLARDQVLQLIWEEEKKTNPLLLKESLEVWPEEFLPVIVVRVENYSTIKKLKTSALIRYAEPMGYDPHDMENRNKPGGRPVSNSGCGSNTANSSLISGVHYNTISPNSKVSWNYQYQGIQNAWTRSTGTGVKIFFIDTGCEFDQENLGTTLNQGVSSGRTIEKIVTLPRDNFLGIPIGPVETPDDACGHGTSMTGACAAPRGTDGAACGVAYNCNLVTCRAAADVYLNESREVKGVADAYINAANRSDVKIISMSMGRITGSGQISDAISYAYASGKLIFCAAGTSFNWTAGWFGVIFPATLIEVQAVTGVEEFTDLTNCDACHKGSQVDFVVVMQKSSDGKFPLSLAMSGDVPSTVGGSSVATASCAGMAALIWARFPWLTRGQVLMIMQQNSSRYPIKSTEYGWGILNVGAATY